jgi:hypothetical protein
MRLEEVLPAYREGKRITVLEEAYHRETNPIGRSVLGEWMLDAETWEVVPDAQVLVTREGAEKWGSMGGNYLDHVEFSQVRALARSYLLLLDVAEAAEKALSHPPLVVNEVRTALRAAGFLGEGGEG